MQLAAEQLDVIIEFANSCTIRRTTIGEMILILKNDAKQKGAAYKLCTIPGNEKGDALAKVGATEGKIY